MIRKGHQRNNKLDKIVEVSHVELPPDMGVVSPTMKNRVSLGSVLTRQPSKKNNLLQLNQVQVNVKQKETLIKQLQQQITFKKQQNDAVQQAFRVRQEYASFFVKAEHPQKRLRSIVLGCSYAASHHKTFKGELLKQLRLVLREWKGNRAKAVKFLLLWLMKWINNLFNMLGRSLSV